MTHAQTSFEILKSDADNEEASTIDCPLQPGVHLIKDISNDRIFDCPQWVAVVEEEGKWFAALADNDGEAFDIFLGKEDGLTELEISQGELTLNLL